ncbi:restriction endonuclease subunit S [Salinimicrobium sp. CAU 1759]
MTKSLKELARISYGKDYKSNPAGDKYPIYGTGGIMGFTSKALNFGPAILSGRKGSINNPIYVEGGFWNVDTIYCLKPLADTDPKWLYYNLVNTDLSKLNEATGVPSVSTQALNKLEFKYFNGPIQQQIAKILNTADSVIEKTQETIAKYRAMKQGIMQDLFTRGIDIKTGQLRPTYEDAPHFFKETELGWIPKEWDKKPLGKIGSFRKGNTIPKSMLSSSGVGCIVYGQIYTTYNDNIYQIKSKIPSQFAVGMKKLKKGDILFAGSGETHGEIGKCVSYQGTEDIYPGGDIVILSLENNQVSSYFGYYLNHHSIQKQKAKLGQGSSVIHIYSNHLSRITVAVPPKKEQMVISRHISGIDRLIKKEQANLAKHQSLKKGLMQDLLTGKVEVQV